jgi:polyhydroxybutyrate depolymerase
MAGITQLHYPYLNATGKTPPKGERIHLTAGGLPRTAILFSPAHPPKGGAILLVVLHGHSGDAAEFADKTNLPALWPEAYVVFPQGLPAPGGQDPDATQPGWQKNVGELGDRDLQLFDELLNHISSKKKTGFKKVYVAGFSNGGRMTFVLWSARPKVISAVAVCAGNSTSKDLDSTFSPKPAVLIHGKDDDRMVYTSAVESINAVLAANKTRASLPGWPWRPTTMLYRAGRGGADTLVITHPGGHSWPTRFSQDVVNFFKGH